MGVERISISFWQTRYLKSYWYRCPPGIERRFLIKKKIFDDGWGEMKFFLKKEVS